MWITESDHDFAVASGLTSESPVVFATAMFQQRPVSVERVHRQRVRIARAFGSKSSGVQRSCHSLTPIPALGEQRRADAPVVRSSDYATNLHA